MPARAMGPLLAAWIILPQGQPSLAWFAIAALIAIVVLARVGGWYKRQHIDRPRAAPAAAAGPVSPAQSRWSIAVLVLLIFSKYFYVASITSYFSFYLIDEISYLACARRRSTCPCFCWRWRSARCSAARWAIASGANA